METKNQRPILFSTAMVQAILMGDKTQTRRIVKIPEEVQYSDNYQIQTVNEALGGDCDPTSGWEFSNGNEWLADLKCPYGAPDDILWVRESWCLTQPYGPEEYYFGYKAGTTHGNKASEKYDYSSPDIWKPSIHMPREACRLFLKIVSVGVERLQNISNADSLAEGISAFPLVEDGKTRILYGATFDQSEQKINGTGSWTANPWVWVVEFERTVEP
jgi:hypothetical protein